MSPYSKAQRAAARRELRRLALIALADANRPEDIPLPKGWTWERVEAQRAKWDIGPTFVPIATAPGCVGWGTINSVRQLRSQ